MNNNEDFNAMVKRYNDEMQQYIKTAVFERPEPQKNANENDEKIFVRDEDERPESLKDIEEDEYTNDDSTRRLDGTGYITVEVSTANGAVPVADANVIITRKHDNKTDLEYNLFTNSSGRTPKVSLKTVKKEQSLSPEDKNPFEDYNIAIVKPGYYTVEDINVPVFDTQTAYQPVNMIPLPDNYNVQNRVIEVNENPVL